MRIFSHKPKKAAYVGDEPYTMLRVSTKEALSLIRSLSQQLTTDNPNDGRLESYIQGYGYFSISVSDEEHDYERIINMAEQGIAGLRRLVPIEVEQKARRKKRRKS